MLPQRRAALGDITQYVPAVRAARLTTDLKSTKRQHGLTRADSPAAACRPFRARQAQDDGKKVRGWENAAAALHLCLRATQRRRC